MGNVKEKQSKNLFYFLLALILLRPCLDIMSQQEFQIYPGLPYFKLSTLIGGMVFIVCLLFILKNLKKTFSTKLLWPISVFLGLCLISIFYSSAPLLSIQEFIRLVSIFLLYFLTYQLIKTQKDFFLLVKIILISYVLPGLFALLQFAFGLGLPDDFGGFNRIYGTFAHPNPFAFYTFFILGLTLSFALFGNRIPKFFKFLGMRFPNPAFLYLGTAILIFLLFATYTRSAMACLLIFILFLGIFKYRKLLLAGLFLFLLAYFFSDVFQERLWQLITLDPYGSVVWRFRLWQDMFSISLWQPWLGYGLGTFPKLVEFYRGFSWGSLEAHNDYLKILVENGVLGLLAYAWLILALLLNLFRTFKNALLNEKTLSLGILAISISLFAASFFDNVLRATALQWNFWILLSTWLSLKSKGT